MSSKANPLWEYFYRGKKQNNSHFATYCKACVHHFQAETRTAYETRIEDADEAKKFAEKQKWFDDGEHYLYPKYMIETKYPLPLKVCKAAKSVRGEKTAFIAHLIGSCQNPPCPYASPEAKDEANAQREAIQNEKKGKKEGSCEVGI